MNKFDTFLAFFVNLFVPGVGQMFQLRYKMAVIFFVGTVIGYMVFPCSGMLMHIASCIDILLPKKRENIKSKVLQER